MPRNSKSVHRAYFAAIRRVLGMPSLLRSQRFCQSVAYLSRNCLPLPKRQLFLFQPWIPLQLFDVFREIGSSSKFFSIGQSEFRSVSFIVRNSASKFGCWAPLLDPRLRFAASLLREKTRKKEKMYWLKRFGFPFFVREFLLAESSLGKPSSTS